MVGIPALLGAKDRGLLLGLADEEHPFVAGEAVEVLMGDVVLALAPFERDEVDPLDRRRTARCRSRTPW